MAVKAKHKELVVEASGVSRWIARTLREYVDKLIICDPRKNALISRQMNKSDESDAYQLCRLLRMDELSGVYQPSEDDRIIFKTLVDYYQQLNHRLIQVKQKIKANYRTWGVYQLEGTSPFGPSREQYLSQLPNGQSAAILQRYYEEADWLEEHKKQACQDMCKHSRRHGYKELDWFAPMPGAGIINTHIFSAYIQTPHRFSNASQLWAYAKLGVVKKTSDGRKLNVEKLSRQGHGVLKWASHSIYLGAMHCKKPNEIQHFFNDSLERTGNRTHARLNTQRKILTCLWKLWSNKQAYSPERFYRLKTNGVSPEPPG